MLRTARRRTCSRSARTARRCATPSPPPTLYQASRGPHSSTHAPTHALPRRSRHPDSTPRAPSLRAGDRVLSCRSGRAGPDLQARAARPRRAHRDRRAGRSLDRRAGRSRSDRGQSERGGLLHRRSRRLGGRVAALLEARARTVHRDAGGAGASGNAPAEEACICMSCPRVKPWGVSVCSPSAQSVEAVHVACNSFFTFHKSICPTQ